MSLVRGGEGGFFGTQKKEDNNDKMNNNTNKKNNSYRLPNLIGRVSGLMGRGGPCKIGV